ncbi:hypothetical protein FQA47_007947 [Oryzias melastigma]|uniref:Uncharacterized protein n=1 Tax=Oryzias melastigma TaxID=30732 RepID=A0A834FAN7_ORYME|nr:hypothetical protein FQA47_007947 [Oryzias melastigma]
MKKPQNASVHVNISSLVYDTPAPGGVHGWKTSTAGSVCLHKRLQAVPTTQTRTGTDMNGPEKRVLSLSSEPPPGSTLPIGDGIECRSFKVMQKVSDPAHFWRGGHLAAAPSQRLSNGLEEIHSQFKDGRRRMLRSSGRARRHAGHSQMSSSALRNKRDGLFIQLSIAAAPRNPPTRPPMTPFNLRSKENSQV